MAPLSSAQISKENKDRDPSSISSLQLSHRALSDVSCLTDFANLEKLDLSCNTLSSLEALGSCISLKWLSVVQNKLQSLKGIEGLSNLTVLNAGKNKLRSMDEVRCLISLRALILNDNEIASICRLDQLSYLNTLVLSRNPIHDIGDSLVKVKSITKLSLSNCRVQTIGSSLKYCVDLKEVRLAHNEITMLPAELAQNVKIQILDLGDNLIRNWSDLQVLSSLQQLKNLNLQGNPIAEKAKLPIKVKKLLPNLQIFNAKPIERDNIRENSKKKNPSHSKEDPHLDGAADHEAVREVKRKKPDPSLVSKKNITSQSEEDNSHIASDLEAGKKVKRKKPKILDEGKPEGIDDGGAPFMELVLSASTGDPTDGSGKKRDVDAIQDVKSLSGVVSVSSNKKKTKSEKGMGHRALDFLLPPAEIGMGGPSTWND